MKRFSAFLLFSSVFVVVAVVGGARGEYRVHCETRLQMGQFICSQLPIDRSTQQIAGCTSQRLARVNCTAAQGIVCEESESNIFQKNVTCRYTNGYSFELSLLLSVFFGMFGADRFYLGYPAIGLLKLSTLGFMFIGQLVDVLLIAMQLVGPVDGSDYVTSHYGPTIQLRRLDNDTYRMPQIDW